MDILYILGNATTANYEELRFSLRTLAHHLKGYGRVIVVGEDPGFLSDVVEFYPVAEAKGNKEYRISQKILYACKEEIVTGDFLFMNDDFFFCKDVVAREYPYLQKGSLFGEAPDKNYEESLRNTGNYLRAKGKTQLHFDVHTPIIYNAEKYMALVPHFQESKKMVRGFVVKSLYSNIYEVPHRKYEDVKLSRLRTAEDFERLKHTDCFSCSDAGWRNGVGNYLVSEFQDVSPFESDFINN